MILFVTVSIAVHQEAPSGLVPATANMMVGTPARLNGTLARSNYISLAQECARCGIELAHLSTDCGPSTHLKLDQRANDVVAP